MSHPQDTVSAVATVVILLGTSEGHAQVSTSRAPPYTVYLVNVIDYYNTYEMDHWLVRPTGEPSQMGAEEINVLGDAQKV